MRAFIVIGAPRSGTSLVAGILDRNGINMADAAPRDLAMQPTGYYEDNRFSQINDQVIGAAGGHFLTPPDDAAIAFHSSFFEDALKRIIDQRIEEAHGSDDWGFKCPRTALVWALYERVWSEFPKPRTIICHRNPLNTAQSIYAAFNKSPLSSALAVVARYESKMAWIAANVKRSACHISFENWWHPANSITQKEALDKFVRRKLDYSHFDESLWRA